MFYDICAFKRHDYGWWIEILKDEFCFCWCLIQSKAYKSRRFMIYVHSKGMIVDDEYVIIGSANINHGWIKGYRDCNGCLSAVSYMGPQQAGSQRPGEPISLVVFLMRGCGSYNYQLLASVLCEISYIFGQIISYYQRFHPKLGSSITHLSPAHFRHWEYIILLVGKLTVRWQPLEND